MRSWSPVGGGPYWRWTGGRVKAMAGIVHQILDNFSDDLAIFDEQRAELVARSPHNVVEIDLLDGHGQGVGVDPGLHQQRVDQRVDALLTPCGEHQ